MLQRLAPLDAKILEARSVQLLEHPHSSMDRPSRTIAADCEADLGPIADVDAQAPSVVHEVLPVCRCLSAAIHFAQVFGHMSKTLCSCIGSRFRHC